ncbi:hypothetical protein SAMN04488057_10714 [Cyclobacterium lianum]|uniref:FAR-17a/AIG1-like protein n=1 Tax=Cyclobacterium lianum TaxID=388280 RepID=A0A1M7P501_9BACT|nr:Pr6Pr family membrane protein [Cyclobacterium lianum]SHN11583.1 hypothetical protein SAMN04488057_10714 [Cyclobacterium lianum]
MKKTWTIIAAAIVWFAVVAQLCLMLQNTSTDIVSSIVRFFSYFTILTNSLVAIYFSVLAWGKDNTRLARLFHRPGTLTAITVYILVVGLVYQIVLRGIWEPEGLQRLVDELLHSFNPLLVLVFWISLENKNKVEWRLLPYWLIYPALYLLIILLLGEITAFYPYPFVDVSTLGLARVLMNSFYVLMLMLCIAAVLLAVGKYVVKRSMAA